jgi:hypothetical protein
MLGSAQAEAIELPDREPVLIPDESAEQLDSALWEAAATVRGSVSAAARIKRATAHADGLRTPLVFDGVETEAVTAALLVVQGIAEADATARVTRSLAPEAP